ncbi:MAG: hypothetical protein IT536_01590 [Hyphomicrobiales bacterium]|nr:hypothetical protein [Hyphomicrobiales bacterium]
MSALAGRLGLVAALLVFFVPSADAQRIHPRCSKSKDKVRCTCALDNGALTRFIPGRGRVIMYRESKQTVNEAFIRCMLRHGRS